MPNKIYVALETPITFRDSTGTVALALQNLAFGAGVFSSRRDRGAGSLPGRHQWIGVFQFATAPAVGEAIDIFLSESDGTFADGNLATTGAALVSDKRNNLKHIGRVRVDVATATTNIIGSNYFFIGSRYYSIGVWNGSAGDNLVNTANVSQIIITATPDEIQ